MRKLLTVLGVLILVGAIAAPVMAHGPGWGKGRHMMGYSGGGPGYYGQYGRGYDNLTAEQRTQLDKLSRKFFDETSPLRNEIWTKKAALNTLLSSSSPDAEKAKALQKEISDLKAKMALARIDYELEVRKINPDARFGSGYGRGSGHHMWGRGPGMGYGHHMGGYGHHMGGYGPGMGYGRNMGGYGQGYCWN